MDVSIINKSSQNEGKHHIENILLLLIFTSLILPPFIIFRFTINFDDIITLTLLPFILFLRPRIYLSPILLLFILLLLSILLSIFYGYLFLNVPTNIRDFNEFVRYFKYVFIIVNFYYCDVDYLILKLHKVLYFCSIIIVVISFCEYFNIFYLAEFFGNIYTSGSKVHMSNLLSSGHRIMATGSDANVGAAIILYFVLYNFICYFYKKNSKYLLINALLIFSLLFTQSRTIFIGLILVFFVWFFTSKQIKNNLKFGFILVGVIFSIYLLPYFKYLYSGLLSVFTNSDVSLNIRYKMWQNALDLFYQSPLFGWGVAKSIHPVIVGLILLLSFILYTPVKFMLRRQKFKDADNNFLIIAYLTVSYSFVSIFFMFTNNFFSGYKVFLFYLSLSLIVSIKMTTLLKK